MTYELHTHIELDGAEYACAIEFERSPRIPAQTSGPVEACYPASGGELEVTALTVYRDPALWEWPASEPMDWDDVPKYERGRLELAMHDYADGLED